jgi:hypothetical protein
MVLFTGVIILYWLFNFCIYMLLLILLLPFCIVHIAVNAMTIAMKNSGMLLCVSVDPTLVGNTHNMMLIIIFILLILFIILLCGVLLFFV